MKKLSEVYDELDESLKNVMVEFWKKYPMDFWKQFPNGASVGYSGSVRHGVWHVNRNREIFNGLTFKPSDKQMDEIVRGKTVVYDSDLIDQNRYEDPLQ